MRPVQVLPIVGLVALAVAGILVWRYTPLADWADPKQIADALRHMAQSPWAPLALAAAYIAANLLFFPITAVNIAVILAFGALWGPLYALAGCVLGAALLYGIGAAVGRKPLEQLDIKALNKPLSLIRESGLPGLILLRMLPVAPYSVANLVLGASGVRFGVYLLGTALGLLPSVLLIAAVGFQLRAVLEDPTPMSVSLLVGVVLLVLGLAWWLKQRLSQVAASHQSDHG